MNYIKHLNALFKQISKDPRLHPTHVSLYMALFHFWNLNRFATKFHIDREEVMHLAKIGSITTYHRCIKNLHHWKYIYYLPSHSPYVGSRVKMLEFTSDSPSKNETSSRTTPDTTTGTSPKLRTGPNTNNSKPTININKHKLPKNKNEVLIFFKKKNWPIVEAEKFYNHYSAIGWKIGGKIKIVNWRSVAENWLLKAKEIEKNKQKRKEVLQNRDNLKTTKDKNYGEPL